MWRIHFEKNISDPEPAAFLHGNSFKISNKAPPNIIAKNESSAEWCDSLIGIISKARRCEIQARRRRRGQRFCSCFMIAHLLYVLYSRIRLVEQCPACFHQNPWNGVIGKRVCEPSSGLTLDRRTGTIMVSTLEEP